MRQRPIFVLVSFAALGGVACADAEEVPATSSAPTLSITSPAQGATVATEQFDVAFTVTDFTLAAPGTCAGKANCGHVHVLVDGTACNDPDAPYNNAGAASPVKAKLDLCAAAAGTHSVVVELHNDDHTPVLAADAVVQDSVDVTYTAVTPTTPSITITAPAAGPVATETFDVAFTTANFTLKAPGTCAGAADCGHVHLLVDGAACNGESAPYNNAGAASPITADLGFCDTAAGSHDVKLELHNDDHSAVMDGANIVSAQVTVTFTEAATGPSIAITSPAPAATVDLDADFTVPVAITTTDFTLAAPGACGAAADCGHVHLLVDGTDCNDASTPYNNAGASNSIAANLALCAEAEGEHEVTVELHKDDHSPVQGANDATISAKVTFTVASSKPRILIVSPAEGASVTPIGDDKTVPIGFKLAGFVLQAAGTCGSNTACGHAHLVVDGPGPDCNKTGRPYNNDGEASPLDAVLAQCGTVAGTHTVAVELHKDDHSPLKENNAVVQATVTFTAQ